MGAGKVERGMLDFNRFLINMYIFVPKLVKISIVLDVPSIDFVYRF